MVAMGVSKQKSAQSCHLLRGLSDGSPSRSGEQLAWHREKRLASSANFAPRVLPPNREKLNL